MLVIIKGGLGNQMFQAAFATILFKKFNKKQKLINIASNARIPRKWELDVFNLHPKKLMFDRVFKITLLLLRFSHKYLPIFRNYFLYDSGKLIDINKLEKSPLIVDGYWQNASYYENNKPLLKNLFSTIISDFKSDIIAVAIHIRRGDYVSDPIAASYHLTCDNIWYEEAWKTMQKRVPNCIGKVFSDDIDWVKENLNFSGNIEYINNKSSEPHQDMMEMIKCNHFIISNSSFSWWAAFLGQKDDSIILAPRFWFKNQKTEDLGICPSSWELI